MAANQSLAEQRSYLFPINTSCHRKKEAVKLGKDEQRDRSFVALKIKRKKERKKKARDHQDDYIQLKLNDMPSWEKKSSLVFFCRSYLLSFTLTGVCLWVLIENKYMLCGPDLTCMFRLHFQERQNLPYFLVIFGTWSWERNLLIAEITWEYRTVFLVTAWNTCFWEAEETDGFSVLSELQLYSQHS